MLLENALQRASNRALRGGKSRALRIGGLAKQELYALAAKLSDANKIHDLPVNRGNVKLKVAAVVNDAERRVDCEGASVRNRMVHVNEFHAQISRHNGFARLHGAKLGTEGERMLLCILKNTYLSFEKEWILEEIGRLGSYKAEDLPDTKDWKKVGKTPVPDRICERFFGIGKYPFGNKTDFIIDYSSMPCMCLKKLFEARGMI